MNRGGRTRGWVARAGRLGCSALLLVGVGCHSGGPEAQRPPSAEQAASASPQPAAPEAAVHHEALPRSVAGVTLGMTVAAAESALGHLTCHDNKAGYRVCTGEKEQIDDVRHLELYVSHDRVISVSYEGPAPANAWDALDDLIGRYGSPSLSGVRERDTSGRLHEIYGWKDDQSLYSVRFMWRDTERESPELVGTVIALWDRKGYQQWEAESRARKMPPTAVAPTAADQPREEI
jgi:hypothetical protein